MAYTVDRPTKSAAKPAEKPAIIFVRTLTRKQANMPSPHPAVVLDTNVVLDWLVFRNPGCDRLVRAIHDREVQWIATQAMRNELAHVLARPDWSKRAPDLNAIWESWRMLSFISPDPQPEGPASRLRCTDPDDQKFIDLAMASARWLVSRDRAVLKLARRARPLGVRVLTPEQWTPE